MGVFDFFCLKSPDMSLFKKNKVSKGKNPSEVVKSMREALTNLEKAGGNEKTIQKAVDDITKQATAMKVILYGDVEHEPQPEQHQQLAAEIFNSNLISRLIANLPYMEFEARKDVGNVINNLLRKGAGGRSAAAEHIAENPDILFALLHGYENPEIALNCGSILRECIRHEPLARTLLYSPELFKFFTYVEVANFDSASDAFASFKDLLTLHKEISAEFLDKNYEQVFTSYTGLLKSTNYVTRRLSLKLLGELLLDRTHFNIMTRYISDPNNLKLMMNLLRDKSKNIQFEAFHVFKVFVANPNKPKPILDILLKNKQRLIPFLTAFQKDREAEDEQFRDEKAFLLKQIEQLSA